MTTLRFIMGDQLSLTLSSLRDCDKASDIILMTEVYAEAVRVHHHKKKLIFIFSAMRHFSALLESKKFNVIYHQALDNKRSSFTSVLSAVIKQYAISRVIFTEPSEYCIRETLDKALASMPVAVEIRPDDRFLCSIDAFADWAGDKRTLRMEFFYREMRKKHKILMVSGKPVGGQWNFDKQNRKRAPSDLEIPPPKRFKPDVITQQVIREVETHFCQHFGETEDFHFAVTARQAQRVLDDFIELRLIQYGDYQDAMLTDEPWMFHAHIGLYLNIGLLLPTTCIQAAVKAYEQGRAPLNAVEGFIRQILGWREFVRGLYWLKMPGYASMNSLNAKNALPACYWQEDKTAMHCIQQCVRQTRQHAYAHHIQRLMILGNFALLLGVSPDALNTWYMIVYADAYQWVELPNVSGMALFADGGLLASKPYAASGAYINKMSDYCKQCHYNVKDKVGEKACPFNYLYWAFMIKNRGKLEKNPRLTMVYRTLDKMKPQQRASITQCADHFMDNL